MTKEECAVVMAYTGVCMLEGEDIEIFIRYLDEILERETYELGNDNVWMEIKAKSREDFIRLCREAK